VPAFVTRFTRKCPGYSSGAAARDRAWGHAVAITGRAAAQVLVRPLVVVLARNALKALLVRRERAAGRADGAGLQRFGMRSWAALSWGVAGRERWCWMPSRIHQTFELREAVNAGVAKGTPLSVRIACAAMGTKGLHEAGPYAQAFRGQQALAG